MEGRTVWVQDGDVDGRIEAGCVVTAARALDSWCLRGDDGSAPIAAGAALQIVETRVWGAAMAEELPALSAADDPDSRQANADAWVQAALELQQLGLFEVRETVAEVTPSGAIVLVDRAVAVS